MKRFLVVSTAVLILSTLPAFAAPTLTSKTRELSQLNDKLQKLETKLKENVNQREVLVQELQSTETRISDLNLQLSTTRQKLRQQRKVLEKCQAELDQLEAKLHSEQLVLAKQLRAAYQLGHHEYAKLVLNQEKPGQISRFLEYYEYISVARNELIQSVKQTLDQLAASKAAMMSETAILEKLLAEKNQEHQQLVKERAYRQNVLSHEDQSISTKQSQIENLSRNKNALESLIQQLKLQASTQHPRRSKTQVGQLSSPTTGQVVNHFGKPITGTEFIHNGILIHAPLGQKVHAIDQGKVVFAEWMRGFGLLMIIDHGHGLLSLYAHNDTLYKKVGDAVIKGEDIATVGHSGGFKTSGLYFEMRRNGKPVNPMGWIKTATA